VRGARHPGRAALLAVLALVLGGCELGYYWQASGGQLDILRRRRPLEEVLADPAVAEPVKARLRLVTEVQGFGQRALAIPEDAAYRTYADLGRPQVTWLVVASEPFAFRAVESCFLLVGCFGYRGYFEKADGDAFAARLAAEGYDVLVRPVTAYSTLGWFDDPVLNTFLGGSEADLAATILHEQAHRVLWVTGDTTFNESFATLVAEEGVRRFLAARPGGEAAWERYRQQLADRARFRAIVRRGRERLERLYAGDMPREAMAAEKARLFDAMRRDFESQRNRFTIVSYEAWFAQALNNAHLVGIGHYHARVPAFRALLRREEGDFARFFAAVRRLADLPPAEREAALDALHPEPPPEEPRAPG